MREEAPYATAVALLLVLVSWRSRTVRPWVGLKGWVGQGRRRLMNWSRGRLPDNLDLHAARAEIEAARGRLFQAGLRPNPMLDLGAQQSVTGPDNNLNVGVTLPLDLNRRKAGRVGVAEQ